MVRILGDDPTYTDEKGKDKAQKGVNDKIADWLDIIFVPKSDNL